MTKNILAALAAASILASTLIAGATEPAPSPPTAPAACAKRTVIDADGTIHVITRCVLVSK